MDILQQFGIEGKLLIVQLVNFTILAVVMWKFVLPRVTSLLDERKETITESLKEAERARKEAAAADEQRDQELERARAEADRVIAEAGETAQAEAAKIMEQAKVDAERVRTQNQEQLAAERTKLQTELRAELGSLAVATTRKVLEDVVTKRESSKMVAAAEKKLKGRARAGRR